MRRFVFVFLAALASACSTGALGAPCARHSDCTSGYCSADGTCATPLDAGPGDAGETDIDATELPPGPEDANIEEIDAPVDAGDDVDAPDDET